MTERRLTSAAVLAAALFSPTLATEPAPNAPTLPGRVAPRDLVPPSPPRELSPRPPLPSLYLPGPSPEAPRPSAQSPEARDRLPALERELDRLAREMARLRREIDDIKRDAAR